VGGKRLRNSGVDEVLEPWWVTFKMCKRLAKLEVSRT
jgi:hypothetical protein